MSGIKYNNFFVVDLEAQCWDDNNERPLGYEQEIIEIGIVRIDLQTLEIHKCEEFLIRPRNMLISKFCEDLTSITEDQLKEKGVDLGYATKRIIQKYATSHAPWGSWGSYDARHLGRECERLSVKSPMSSCHVNIKSIVCPFFGWKKELGLQAAMDALGMEMEGTHHRGNDDAYNTARVYLEILKKFRS